MHSSRNTLLIAAIALLAGSAVAQTETKPQAIEVKATGKPVDPSVKPAVAVPEQPASVPAAPKPAASWSDPDFAKIGGMLVGSWKTAAPVSQTGGEAGAKSDVLMNVAHVGNSELKDTLYMELTRADAPQAPYRQAILQLYKAGGQTRLRTFDILGLNCDREAFTGLWAVPELFPDIKSANLLATMDIVLTPDGDGFSGKTLHPFTTSRGGAVEATNELSIKPGSFSTVDKGLDTAGKVVWGASDTDKYSFTKATPALKIEKRDGGLVVIDFLSPAEGDKIETNDRVVVQYSGWTTDGFKFDSSRGKPQPLTFTAGNLIPGWDQGVVGASKGTRRRMYVPSALGYGEQGNPRAKIPGNTDIIFDIEVLSIEKAQRPVEPPADGQPVEGQPAAPK